MKKLTSAAAAALIMISGASAAPSADEKDVLAAMDALMRAVPTDDKEAMSAILAPEGMIHRFRKDANGSWDLAARPTASLLSGESDKSKTFKERYWSPTVLIRGSMAFVWAPYELLVDGASYHCGVDAISFAKIDGAWKATNLMWTAEKDACAELRPDDPSTIRPHD